MPNCFGYVPIASPLHDLDELQSLLGAYYALLDALGGERRSADDLLNPAPLIWLVGTGGTERQILQYWAERHRADEEEPVVLIAHPGHNSLAAALETLARLQQDGAAGRVVYVDGPGDTQGSERVKKAVQDLLVNQALRSTRIGLLGSPSDWLVASSPEPRVVRSTWGPAVHGIPLDTLREGLERLRGQPFDDAVQGLVSRADAVVEPTRQDLLDAARVYGALRAIVDTEDLHALSVRCFDLVVEQKTTACYALSRLNDEGVVAGCEGDLVSTVGMLWAQQLVGTIPWMANPSRLDPVENSLWLAHCTVPCSMVRSYRLRSHFESGAGVGIAGQFSLGPVTLFRLGGSNLERLWVAEGELDATGADDHLCRTQIRVRLDHGHVQELLMNPLGNHLLVLPSRHAVRLRAWWELVIAPRMARASS